MSETTQSTKEHKPVQLSDSALRRIAELQKEETAGMMLRVAVDGGGCSGFQYKFEMDQQQKGDHIVDDHLLIDDVSLPFLEGAVIDYVETLGAAHFEIKNPNATASCGCGNSFSV